MRTNLRSVPDVSGSKAIPRRLARAAWGILAVGTAATWSAAPLTVSAQTAAADADLYEVRAVAAARTAQGQPWDGDSSAPDMQLTVVTPGGTRSYTTCNNALTCTWVDVYLPRGATLQVRDADVLVADVMGAGPCEGVTPNREATCQLGAATLTITPRVRAQAGQRQQEVAAARPRRIRPPEVRALLVGRSITTATGAVWTFVATEPLQARLVSQRVADGVTTLVVRIRTNDATGRQPASGDVQVVVRWVEGRPTVESVEPLTFAVRAR